MLLNDWVCTMDMEKKEGIAILVKSKRRRNKERIGLLLTQDSFSALFIDAELYETLGKIAFNSSSGIEELIEDFSEKYLGSLEWHNPLEGHSASGLRYPSSYEPTITQAFVNYFSNLKS